MRYTVRGGSMMNILEYIEYLKEKGYNDEQAERFADIIFGGNTEEDRI